MRRDITRLDVIRRPHRARVLPMLAVLLAGLLDSRVVAADTTAGPTDPARACDSASALPFGMIADVAVTEPGDLYLLDQQLKTVHHVSWTSTGETVVKQIGSEGEGPGEMWAPYALAAHADFGVTVFQNFSARAVAFDPQGRDIEAPDVAPLRQGALEIGFVRAARIDDGRSLVSVMRIPDIRTGAEPRTHRELVLLEPRGGDTTFVLSSDEARESAYGVSAAVARRALHDQWDVSPDGLLVMPDPDRFDGLLTLDLKSGRIDRAVISVSPEIESASRAREAELGIAPNALPYAGQITWLRPGVSVLVRPLITMTGDVRGGTPPVLWIHHLDGATTTRVELDRDISGDDLVSLRNGRLVVVEGAARARREQVQRMREALGETGEIGEGEGGLGGSTGSEAVCVAVYDFRGHADAE